MNNTPDKRQKIFQINVNSIVSKNKRHNLDILLKKHKPTIVLLNETKLNTRHKVQFKNYNFIRTDRITKQGGGTGILIKTDIKFERIDNQQSLIQNLEYTAIKIFSGKGGSFFVASVYLPPTSAFLDQDMKNLLKLANKDRVIIGGDFNAKHQLWSNKPKQTNTNGINMYNWYTNNCINLKINIVHSLLPTRNQGDSHTYLDLFLVSDGISILYDQNTPNHLKTIDFESDHCVVELKISTENKLQSVDPIIIPNYSQTNWRELRTSIDEKLDDIEIPIDRNMSPQEIDNTITELNTVMIKAIEMHVPKTTIKNTTNIPLPASITKLIDEKNKMRKKWFRQRYDSSAHRLKSEIKCLNKIITEQINHLYNENWSTKLQNIEKDNNVFKNIKKFSGNNTRIEYPNLTETLINGLQTTAKTTIDKANMLGKYFESVHTQNHNTGCPNFTIIIDDLINKNFENNSRPLMEFNSKKTADMELTDHHPFPKRYQTENKKKPNNPHIRTAEILKLKENNENYMNLLRRSDTKNFLKTRKNKKSSGPDKIPNFILRKLSSKFHYFITILFNQIYVSGYFPKIWKEATIIPLLKPRKPPQNTTSYRPISLLCCLSKIYECFINEKLRAHCEDNDVLPDTQFGFRPRHSTTHALLKFSEDVCVHLNNKTPIIACSLDTEKAFDTVWQNGIIYKMQYQLGFNEHLCKIIYNYLQNRTFKVEINKIRSAEYKIKAGVPQGSIMAALLYIIYTADMPKPKKNNHLPVQTLSYADDVLVYSASKRLATAEKKLNEYIDSLNDYMKKWKISLNADKSEVLVITGKNNYKKAVIKADQKEIKNCKRMKYLGITFTSNFQFNTHMDEIKGKATGAFLALKNVLRPREKMKTDIKLICYKQLIRPVLMYGFPVWFNVSSHQMEKLRIFERKCLRTCTDYHRAPEMYKHIKNRELYIKADTERIDRTLVRQALTFYEKLELTENKILKSCGNFEEEYLDHPGNKFKPPHTLLRLRDNHKLYDSNDKLIYYHRPHNHRDGIVYRTGQ